MDKVLFGIDHFCKSKTHNKNARIGLVTNDIAANTLGVKTRIALITAGFNIVKLFSPEHGLSAHAPDGSWVPNAIDELTNLPVVSLYADKLQPSEANLEDVDTIVFDIPDVGCRFYTYLWTMTYMMEACAQYHKKFIILDRPNPLSGDRSKVEGPMLDDVCASFIGRWNIPIRHCCTLGELANYFSASQIHNLDIEIIKIQHWNRNDFPNTQNWSFVPTSPAIKDAETALLYPGLGLLEGINVNEGRGTDKDFKIFGAPWINASALKEKLDRLDLPGITFAQTRYVPKWGLYQQKVCYGLEFHITVERSINPVALGIAILSELIVTYPEDCKERLYKTNANPSGEGHLDKLLGIQNAFDKIKNGNIIETQIPQEKWSEIIAPYLLY